MPATLFISDLHLDPDRPEITGLFLDFLGKQARGSDALYILGDLFEAWIGDDDDSPMNRRVSEAIHSLVEHGTPVFLMHGNRDFLVGGTFEQNSGCSLIDDPTRIDLYGTPTLLMHGDTLCTDDREYMAFREMVRNPEWQQDMLSRPLDERRQIADDMRRQSREQNSGKPEAIMDVNAGEVENTMGKHAVTRLIHGHTHRPGKHALDIGGARAERIVLGDWYREGSVLVCTRQGCELEKLPLSQDRPA